MPLIEKRYAEALIGLTSKSTVIDDFQKELDAIVELYINNQDFRLFLINPKINTAAKKSVIENTLGGMMKKEIISFILLLLDKGRIRNLPGIMIEYSKAVDKIKNSLNLTIISAAPLEDKQINSIIEKYKRQYSSTNAIYHLEIDKSLIGGVKVKIGDKIVDGSISARLKGLREALLED